MFAKLRNTQNELKKEIWFFGKYRGFVLYSPIVHADLDVAKTFEQGTVFYKIRPEIECNVNTLLSHRIFHFFFYFQLKRVGSILLKKLNNELQTRQ